MRSIAASLLLLAANGVATTPVDRVISLLTKLTAQVQAEGIAEAASYDKYACFCKDQADEKVYVIAKSDKKIKDLDADITDLFEEIKALDNAVREKKGEVEGLETTQQEAAEARNGEHEKYMKERKGLLQAIKAVDGAQEAMETSHKDVAEEISSLLQKLPGKSFSSLRALALIADASAGQKSGKPGEATKYQYDSKEVIATLQDLARTFKKELEDLDEAEFGERSSHEMASGARANSITALEKAITEKQKLSASKGAEKSDKEDLKDKETEERNADQAFLDDLTSKCESKAKAWDQRSTTRAAELTALTQAVELLKGMGDLYDSNAKLVGLISKGSQASISQHAPPTLLQLQSSVRHLSMDKRLEQLNRHLTEKAHSLSSAPLAMLALQIEAAGPDHFVKVRGIIKDLISKLEDDAAAEATAKGLCDKNMKSAVDKRDKSAADTETANAQIDTTKSAIATLKGEISDLADQIASLNKDLLEAKQLRASEKADNEKTIEDADAGKTAVDQAVTILNKFYDNAFLQKDDGRKPHIKNRSGETVGDLAPDTFSSDEEYKGAGDSSKGIVGMLEVISSDFGRTSTTVTAAEKQAEEDYDKLKGDMESSVTEKEKTKAKKEGDVESSESDLTGFKGDLKTATEMNDEALEELEKLKASCVDGEETYAERVKHRNEEIAALKQAMQILDDWQN